MRIASSEADSAKYRNRDCERDFGITTHSTVCHVMANVPEELPRSALENVFRCGPKDAESRVKRPDSSSAAHRHSSLDELLQSLIPRFLSDK